MDTILSPKRRSMGKTIADDYKSGPDEDAMALAKTMGFYIQRTRLGDRKSYALLKDGAPVDGMRNVRMFEISNYLRKLK